MFPLIVASLAPAEEIQFHDGTVRAAAPEGASLAVYVDGIADAPALLGSLTRDAETLIFRPRYPFEPGVTYRAEWTAPGREPIVSRFSIPRAEGPVTHVAGVEPALEALPENLLRMYVLFSAPMSRGEAYRRLALVGADGSEIEAAFLEIDQELWDREGRRLTLLLDPGRVKRGLVPNEAEGRALEAGRAYALRIDADWPDAEGRPLAEGFEKRFRATAADYESPDPSRWTITPPAAGSREPLNIEFAEPLDRALAARLIGVFQLPRRSVEGAAEVDAEGSRWSFTPAEPWAAGDHLLEVDPMLEDLAGNSPSRPFETVPGETEASSAPVVLRFSTR